MKNIIIALCSDGSQAGKTTVAEYIQRNYQDTVIESFAAPIKDMVTVLMGHAGLSRAFIGSRFHPACKEEPIPVSAFGPCGSPRRLMQTLGTEWGRCRINPFIWTDILEYKLGYWFSRGAAIVVIDDLRFLGEFEMLSNYEVYVVRINGCKTRKTTGHISDTESNAIDADFCIENDAGTSLGLLYEQVDDIMTAIARRRARCR